MRSTASPRSRPWAPPRVKAKRRNLGVPAFWVLALSLFFLSAGAVTGYEFRLEGSALAETFFSWLPGGENTSPTGDTPGDLLPGQDPGEQGQFNILILGSDARPGESASRTDTIMALVINSQAKKAVLISIPRDLWVSIPRIGEGRINTAYHYGELYDYSGGGVALAEESVEAVLGISFTQYVRINFAGFIRGVDLLGGVEIEVPQDIWDPLYPDENYGYEPLFIPAGRQYMDGETLLKYVRTRYGGDDFDRIRRQQQALRALAQKAISLDLLPRLPELLNTGLDLMETDLGPMEILSLAQLGMEIGLEGLEMRALDESFTTFYVTPDGAQVLLPDYAKIHSFMASLFAE
ncbi:MAG: LCP family protein [Chloroflexi bacterium]|nr:LCP family protein [Chloroflexota bacterium]